ncbi:DUF3693 domain-containing protein [Rhodocyclus gracilis]|nr:DUF3693 domain-containing protein [Rhodocyclus gracilis]
METTADVIEALKIKLGARSDYAIAKKMGWSTSRVCNYRKGRANLDDLAAFQVAEILDLDPAKLIALKHAVAAKNEEERATWKAILERLGGAAALVLLGVGLGGSPSPAQASQTQASETFCIM